MERKLLNLMKGAALGFILGMPSVSVGQTGAALNFDGNSDYVNLGTAINGSLSTLNKITVEAWVRPTTLAGLGDIIGNYSTPANQMQFLLRRNNNTNFQFYIGNSAVGGYLNVSSATAPTVNVWTHLAGTWDGTVASLYVNGVLSSTASITYTSMGVCTNTLWIGGNSINEWFMGDIDEVRIWNRPLCQGEIVNNKNAELPLPQYGLLAYYQMNQGIAAGNNAGVTTATDASPGNTTGTLTTFALSGATSNWITPGGVTSGSLASVFSGTAITVNSGSINPGQVFTMTPSGAPSYTFSSGSSTVAPNVLSTYTVYGYAGGCLNKAVSTVSVSANVIQLDGTDYVTIGSSLNSTLATLNKITVEAWVNPSDNVGYDQLIGNYGTGGTSGLQFLLRRQPGLFAFFVGNGNGGNYVSVSSAAAPTIGVWQHVAATWNGTLMSIYVNGVLSGTGTATYPAMGTFTNEIRMGTNNISENYNGFLDEVRIWNRPLCVSEIVNNMNGELTLPQNGLLSYYKFNNGFAGGNNAGLTSAADSGPANITGTLTTMNLFGLTSNWMAPAGFAFGATVPTFTLPGFAVAGPSLVCMGSSATFTASGANTYSWSNGSLTSTVMVSPTVNASYNVIGTATTGCVGQLTKSVVVAALPSVSAATSETNMLCTGQSATLSASGASTYVWNTTATTAVIVISPTVTTSYTVTGTDANGCQNTATITQNVSNCTGIAVNQKEQLFNIYPNPTAGNFTVELAADASVKISDLSGRMIYSSEVQKGNYKFDLSNYENGIYLVTVRQNDQVRVYKLVKQ